MKRLDTSFMTNFVIGVLIAGLFLQPKPAMSQGTIEEIIVTAQRREQNINDVGIAMNVFGEEAIRKLGIQDSIDLADYTPGLNMIPTRGYTGKVNFTLRGVGLNSFSEPQESGVAIYQDDFYVAPLIGSIVGVFDTERIEILRGPQGTLFGRSSSGGLVHYISKGPTRDKEGYAGVSYGAYDERRFEVAAGGPLSETVSARVAAYWSKYDGWLKNLVGKDQYGEEKYAVRGQLHFSPHERFNLYLKAEHGDLNNPEGVAYTQKNIYTDSDGIVRDLPPDLNAHFTGPGLDWTGFRDTDGEFFTGSWGPANDPHDLRNDVVRDLFSAKAVWDLGSITLTSLTGYLDGSLDYLDSYESTPTDYTHVGIVVDTDEFVQELRLNGESAKYRWTAGAFYFDWDIQNDLFFILPVGLFPTLPSFGDIATKPWRSDHLGNQHKKAIAGYGQIEYDFTDKLTGIIGLRIEREKVDFEYRQEYGREYDDVEFLTGLFGTPPFVFNEQTDGDNAVIDENYFSGTLELDYRPNENTLWYFSMRRGIKPGAFNTPFAPIASDEYKVKEEQVYAFEIGTKATLLDGRMQLNVASYYYDFKDYQAVLSQGANTLLTNADSTIYGLDLEVYVNPTESLNFGFLLSLLEGNAKDVQLNLPGGGFVVSDQEVANAPKYSGTAIVNYEWSALGGTMSLQGDIRYQGKVYFGALNHPAFVGESYVVGDMRAAWNKGSIEIAAFVKNITEEEYIVYAANVVDFGGFSFLTPGKPRWWGIQLRHTW